MRILVTGAGGFIGKGLVSALLEERTLSIGSGEDDAVEEIIATDWDAAALDALPGDPRIVHLSGDLNNGEFRKELFGKPVSSIFHLATTLAADGETDFDHGIQTNLLTTLNLMEEGRAHGYMPRFVYPSSIAAFGGPLPEIVDDKVPCTPQTSYGTWQAIVELLINDYSRQGFLDGRALRLPLVLVGPPGSQSPVSDRISAIIREPLKGQDAISPIDKHIKLPVASVRRVADALIGLHEIRPDRFGHTRIMNLPSLTVTAEEMVAALQPLRSERRIGEVFWHRDDQLQAIVEEWPRQLASAEASRHGLAADQTFDDILRAILSDQG